MYLSFSYAKNLGFLEPQFLVGPQSRVRTYVCVQRPHRLTTFGMLIVGGVLQAVWVFLHLVLFLCNIPPRDGQPTSVVGRSPEIILPFG